MNTLQKQTLGLSMVLIAAMGAALASGCGGDDDGDGPPIITGGRNGNGGTGGRNTAGTNTGGTGEGGDGNGGTGNTNAAGDGSGNTSGSTTGGTSNPPGECFEEPETAPGDVQFLNRCTTSRCSPFDNGRIPGFDGSLPEL